MASYMYVLRTTHVWENMFSVTKENVATRHMKILFIVLPAWLINIISCLLVYHVSGYLYESSGSYRSSLILGGVCVIAVGFIISADPLLRRWQTHLQRRRLLLKTIEWMQHAQLRQLLLKTKREWNILNSLRQLLLKTKSECNTLNSLRQL